MSGALVWVLLLHTDASAVPVGYFVSEDQCITAAKTSDMIVAGEVVKGPQIFTCVSVQGLLNQ